MKLFMWGVLFVALLFGTLARSPAHRQSGNLWNLVPGVDYVQGEVIVVFSEASRPFPPAVRLTEARVGIQQLDNFLEEHEAVKLERLVTTFDMCESRAGRRLERTYLLRFPQTKEAIQLLESLAEMPQIEHASLNRLRQKRFYEVKRYVPQGVWFSNNHWHLDHASNDKVDIDAPEAWAIEKADTSIVIVINDSGTMIDTCGTDTCGVGDTRNSWIIHPDFNHYWIEEEDVERAGINTLNRFDIDRTDANGDGVDDNVIGANFAPGHAGDTTAAGEPTYKLAFWRAMPTNTVLTGTRETSRSWDCVGYLSHGLSVAGIAAAGSSRADVIGVAFQSRVYWVRGGGFKLLSSEWDEAQGIIHSAIYGDVINMSWGYGNETPDSCLYDAISFAANDSDCVLIAAVGNEGYDDAIAYPARFSDVLAVGAVHRVGELDSLLHSSYSNYSSSLSVVDVVAPVDKDPVGGGDGGVYSHSQNHSCAPDDCPCSLNYYPPGNTGEGTSFAAPQASGIAALIRARFPQLNQQEVRERIKRGAEYYWSAADSMKYGAGKVNAYRSITEWGRVETNTTWDIGNDPDTLYVSGDLIIDSGATLTIERGVVVRVAPEPIEHDEGDGDDANRVEIIVRGTLAIDTSGTGNVIFESFSDSPTSSDWGGIKFESGGSGSLHHVVVRNANVAVEAEEFGVSVTDWGTNKELYLNSSLAIGSDYSVASGDSLLVLGDTEVSITGGQEIDLTVSGTLISKGSAAKQPEFVSTTSTAGSWEQIRFDSTSHDNVLHNTNIRHAKLPVRTFIPLALDSCTLSDGVEGIETHASVTVANSLISGMSAYGVDIGSDTTTIVNTEINGGSNGVNVGGSGAVVICRSSYIHDVDYHGIVATLSSQSIVASDTRIEDMYWGISAILGADADIDSCTIRKGTIGVNVLGSSTPVVSSCVIDSNSTTGIYCGSGSHITIEADTISASTIGIHCYGSSHATIEDYCWLKDNSVGVKCDASDPTIRDTKITGGTDGVTGLNDAEPDLGVASADTCGGANAGNNSLSGFSGYHVVNFSPSVQITSECNYGGSKGFKVSGDVDYTPSLDEDPIPTTSQPGPDQPRGEREPPLDTPKFPAVYGLAPGFPNPFNPVMTLRYQVPQPGGHVEIVIFDVRGRKIATLVEGTEHPGYHVVKWNGRNTGGTSVASGVYFIRMRAIGFLKTHKVVLLK